MGTEDISRNMKVVIIIEDQLVGCKIDITTDPEVDVKNPAHEESDALRILGQFLMVVSEQTIGTNLETNRKS